MILLFTIYLIWFYPTESLDVLAVFKKAKHRSVSTHKCELTCMTSCMSNDFSELHVMLYICTYNIDYFFFQKQKVNLYVRSNQIKEKSARIMQHHKFTLNSKFESSSSPLTTTCTAPPPPPLPPPSTSTTGICSCH